MGGLGRLLWERCLGKGPSGGGGLERNEISRKEGRNRDRVSKEKGVWGAKEWPLAEGNVSPPGWDDPCDQELPRPGREGGSVEGDASRESEGLQGKEESLGKGVLRGSGEMGTAGSCPLPSPDPQGSVETPRAPPG